LLIGLDNNPFRRFVNNFIPIPNNVWQLSPPYELQNKRPWG